jgi:hypothetical protein
MIKLLEWGKYRLVGTRDHKVMLYLGQQGYQWGYVPKIGDLLTFSKHPHKQTHMIAKGGYRLYHVKDEPHLVDLKHLELSVSPDHWQGYLLLTGLPTSKKIRSRIVPTTELIMKKRGKNHGKH